MSDSVGTMSSKKRRRGSSPDLSSDKAGQSPRSLGQGCVGAPEAATPRIETEPRRFRLDRSILGDDSVQGAWYTDTHKVCDLCHLFLEACLTKNRLQAGGGRVYDFRSGAGGAWVLWKVFPSYSSRRMLEASAGAGCALCSEALKCLQVEENDKLVFIISGTTWPRESYADKSDREWSKFRVSTLKRMNAALNDNNLGPEFELLLAKDEDECLKMPRFENFRKTPSHSPMSETCLRQIERWRQECVQMHQDCSRGKFEKPLRLIDVQPATTTTTDTCSGDTLVRLVQTPLHGQVCYLALSYCWGAGDGMVTRKTNLASMERGFNLRDLPAAITDAVRLCRLFDVPYLWVDALCICQDDMDEWQDQAAKMADIYGGCEFALSALSSSGSDESFIKPRDFSPTELGSVTATYGLWKDSTKLFLRKVARSLQDEFRLSRLNTRAWPLQERILASAVLHYGFDQVIWECNSRYLVSETEETKDTPDLVIRLSDQHGLHTSIGLMPLWHLIVQEYSQRSLTFNKDRLIGISGIASRFRRSGVDEGRYAAGMWEKGLPSQLLWFATGNSRASAFVLPAPVVEAPTWSWIHLNLPVTLPYALGISAFQSEARFRFDDESVDLHSQTGNMVSSCTIALRGYIQLTTEKAVQDDSCPQGNVIGPPRYSGLPGSGSRWIFDKEPLPPGPYYCLRVREYSPRLLTNMPPLPEMASKPSVLFLVLQKVKATPEISLTEEKYRRLGILALYDVPEEYLEQPYQDIMFSNGRPLLTEGEWKDVVLI